MSDRGPGKYQYDPSLAAAATFATLFGLSTAVHIFQLARSRTWYFIPFLLGAIFEVVGYAARSVNATETPNWTTAPFIIQTLLPLVAPALFAASIYMVLGRIIRLVDAEHLSFISTKWLTKVFVFGDVLSFLVQCGGGGMLAAADTKEDFDRGQNVILVGLGIQIIFFAGFIAVISLFHYRIIRQPTATSLGSLVPWKQYILVLYFTSFLILIRSIFRVIEFTAGRDSVFQTSEVYLYCFDAAPMLLCSAVVNVWHPSRVVSSSAPKAFEGIQLEDGRTTTTEREAMVHVV